jgi:hypothetical protein
MKHAYLIIFFISNLAFSQTSWNDLSGKERAFLFHQARRVDILKPELFHLFEYTDSIPFINDTLPDYTYVEKQIVASPDLVVLHKDEFARKSIGVVNDLCVRFAIWELDQMLQFRNSTAEEDKPLLEKLKRFEKLVLEEAPPAAIKTLSNGSYELSKLIQNYYAPSLTVSDKLAAIVNSGFSQIDQMLIIQAIMTAQQNYVAERAVEIYRILGGVETDYKTYLSAVGDGANWADVVGGFNTPYTIGLPDEKGLFNFELHDVLDKEKNRTNIVVKQVTQKLFSTASDKQTVVHLDVFGYHPERQTTVVIQKGGNSYVLYGKNEHRLVSPDSTYGEGVTYWRLMYNLEHFYIANLKEDLYGKRGYEYQIDLYEKKIEKTLYKIKVTEHKLDILRHTPEGKPKIKKKKIKKKNLGLSDQAGQGHPTSAMSKLDKKKNIQQNILVQLEGDLSSQKATLKKLKEDMEKAYDNLVICETKLDLMKKNMGYIIMEFEQKNHLYTFKDGATFNYLTQDFTFPSGGREESFQVFHIAFGKEVFDEKADENFVQIHVSSSKKTDQYVFKHVVLDDLSRVQLPASGVQLTELFNYLTKKEIGVDLKVVAGGILGQDNNQLYSDSLVKSVAFESGAASNNGLVLYQATMDANIHLSVTVFEDEMVPADFQKYAAAYEKAKLKMPGINEVDFYTGIRAQKAAEDWLIRLKSLVPMYVKEANDQKTVIGKLKKLKVSQVFFLNNKFKGKVPDQLP